MMNISGVLVHARPQQSEAVRNRLIQLDGVEVHAISEEGRIVVTVEQDDTHKMADTVMHLQDIEGVLSAAMIYHHYEDDEQGLAEDVSAFPSEAPCACEDLTGQEASK